MTTTTSATTTRPSATTARPGGGLRRWVCCGSTMTGTGLEAFSALVPKEWTTEGGLRRMGDLGVDPLRSIPRFRTVDPRGEASVELVGRPEVVRGHLDPAGHALSAVVPALRPQALGVRVIAIATPGHVPWPAHGFARSSAATVTVAYIEDGLHWHEELTLAVGHETTGGGELSAALPALSVRAPAAHHVCWAPVLETIRHSFSVNTAWLVDGR